MASESNDLKERLTAASNDLNSGEYEKAFNGFEELAMVEYAPAYLTLGRLYDEGKGVTKDEKMSYLWYSKSADSDDPQGCFYLAYWFNRIGQHRKAFNAYKKASDLGFYPANYQLGFYYRHGRGVEINHKKSIEYFELGAKRGNLFCKAGLIKQLARFRGGALGFFRIPALFYDLLSHAIRTDFDSKSSLDNIY